MKSGKYKFSSDRTADCGARQYLLEFYFLRNFFWGDFHGINEIYDLLLMCNCRQFCPRIGILYNCYSFKNSLHSKQIEGECLRTKINARQRVV